MQALGIGAFLEWGALNNTILPPGVDYIHDLRVGDRCYTNKMKPTDCKLTSGWKTPYQHSLENVKELVPTHPGEYWVIGNEPDTSYENQDDLPAEEYALRYFNLASLIRGLDATARIGFGSIIQPSPIHLRYLDRPGTS